MPTKTSPKRKRMSPKRKTSSKRKNMPSKQALSRKFTKILDADPAIQTILYIGLKVPKKFRLHYSDAVKLENKTLKSPILTLRPQAYKPFLLSSINIREMYIRCGEERKAISGGGDDKWYVLDASLCDWLVKNRDKIVEHLTKEGYHVRTKHPKSRKN